MKREIDIVDHKVMNDGDIHRAWLELGQTMRLDEHRRDIAPGQRKQCRVEALHMTDLKHESLCLGALDKIQRFGMRSRHRLFDKAVNARSNAAMAISAWADVEVTYRAQSMLSSRRLERFEARHAKLSPTIARRSPCCLESRQFDIRALLPESRMIAPRCPTPAIPIAAFHSR